MELNKTPENYFRDVDIKPESSLLLRHFFKLFQILKIISLSLDRLSC